MIRDIPIDRVRALYHYDPLIGLFIAKTKTGRRRIGDFCGSKTRLTKTSKTHYRLISIDGHQYLAHRVAWAMHFGQQPPPIIDHVDTNGSNNAIRNLREANDSLNGANTSRRAHNTSGVKGVSFCRQTGKWRASITIKGRSVNLGRYSSKEEASAAYNSASVQEFGGFARP